MKKLILMLIVLLSISCTQQERTRQWGGKMKVDLPKGQRLLMVTWKENNYFTLTEPMDSTYVPKTKTFQESSSFGIFESSITFVESK